MLPGEGNRNNLATSEALAEVCALMSAILASSSRIGNQYCN